MKYINRVFIQKTEDKKERRRKKEDTEERKKKSNLPRLILRSAEINLYAIRVVMLKLYIEVGQW